MMAMQELELHVLKDVDTDGIDDESFQNVTDVHGEIDAPCLRSLIYGYSDRFIVSLLKEVL